MSTRARGANRSAPLGRAERAHALVQAEPRRAAVEAKRARAEARSAGDPDAEAAALHALGFALLELADPAAVRTLRAAVRAAERRGLARRAALARRTLAGALATSGRPRAGLRELDLACAALAGGDRARAEATRLALLGQSAIAPPDLSASERALAQLRREGDALWEARLLYNRGRVHAERGDVRAAWPDVERARDVYVRLGASVAAADADAVLARLALLRGDIPLCLARVDAIDPSALPPPSRAELDLVRAQALVAARLLPEALEALEAASGVWERGRSADDAAKGRVEIARLQFLAGDPAAARSTARQAARAFAARGQRAHAARASALALEAGVAAGAVGPSALRTARRAARVLDEAGWPLEAARARLVLARAALLVGRRGAARNALGRCAVLRRGSIAADRIAFLHVQSLIALAAGDEPTAERAIRGGLRVLDEHRAALGGSELRATASALGVELARLGLGLALTRRDPGATLGWAERLRANALRLEPVVPPVDPELDAVLTELRRLATRALRAPAEGRRWEVLTARRAALERDVRRRSRHVPGATVERGTLPSRVSLARALRGRALVEYVELGGALHALVLGGGGLALYEVGSTAEVGRELRSLRFALQRLARRHGGERGSAGAEESAAAAAAALDALLVRPLADAIGERAAVLVPTGPLHAVPWALLPTLAGRPVAVAPSASLWLALDSRPVASGRLALIAGPRLAHAAAELDALAATRPDATRLAGREATAAAALAALDGASIAHVACHGHFRSDSPLFSALELADGPLTAFELERLRRPPGLLVLSACDLALSDTHPGDELLGVAAALLGAGTRTLVASVAPVPDDTARDLMVSLHARLGAGMPPSAALAEAIAAEGPAAGGFVCLGAG